MKYDFSGWATKNNLRCSDGRTIRAGAFIDNDGKTVPLVWNHQHNDPTNVLGHALLENRDQGVYAYCAFNDTDAGQRVKSLVKHGDITALSIYANQLKQNGGDVMHGVIREVSIVLAGANPGACIDAVLAHGDYSDEEAIIYTGDTIELYHSDSSDDEADELNHADDGETVQDVFNTLTEKQKKVVYMIIGRSLQNAKGGDSAEHSAIEHSDNGDGETVKDVFDTLNEKQKQAVYAIIGLALEDAKGGKNDNEDEDESEGENMKHNVFDNTHDTDENTLQHSEVLAAMADGKRYGSMREAFLAHGIENIEYLFPDATNLDKTPQFIKRDTGWVSKVLNGAHHSPFSRIKSQFADITEDDARALGYLPDHTHRDSKGNLVDAEGNPAFKKEEVFSLLKRTTGPTTIYKKQKIDRDDYVDITDFDVMAWLKTEMRGMLDEELARAILIGDGRLSSSDDKINEQNIRPIVSDSSFFTIKTVITVPSTATEDEIAKAIIKGAVKSRKKYRGSGNPTCFTTEDYLTNMSLLEDGIGHTLYKTDSEIASAMRVKDIETVPVMENYKDASGNTVDLAAVIVNMSDYNVGADKGGAVNFFDDFDIDYNAMKYLIETRCSGALTKPYSAIVITVVKSPSATEITYAINTSKTI